VTDADGTRQATLLFTPGTQATMQLPDGTTQPLTTLHVRATEYTVSDNGPLAMPAQLPSHSAYTYAVELSVDEAVAAGAPTVQFTQPVLFYVENFLNFPVGIPVPMGFYDRENGLWVASQNGRIVALISITDGVADVDSDGDGVSDDAGMLAALGITDAERQRLASLYGAGQSLWRIPITHFSAWDANWGWGPPPEATPPLQPDPQPEGGDSLDESSCQPGSIIKCEDQSLGETVRLTGTSFRLHYQSDRVPGYKAAHIVKIPLSGASVPASLRRIEVEIDVAGQHVRHSMPAAPNQSLQFTWDGQDAYGRPLQGSQPITIRLGYVYRGVYQQVARFGYTGNGTPITGSLTRQEITLWQEWRSTIGPWDAGEQRLGSWSLNVRHAYDPVSRVLYFGDGRRRSAKELGYVITTVAGNGIRGSGGDGGPATQASLTSVTNITVGPDGSLYIADASNNRIRKVDRQGIITTVAGNGSAGFSGDGGPATQAQLNFPTAVAVGLDGSLYITDSINDRVRRVGTDGIITTVAGSDALSGPIGDGGPAVQARLDYPRAIAIGPDSSLYIGELFRPRIRRVGSDGIITTVAGNGTRGYSGDGGPATQAQLNLPYGVAVGADGSLYIADSSNELIRRVGSDGRITTVAGMGSISFGGDGGPATEAQFDYPVSVVVGAEGQLYIADFDNNRIRRIGSDGLITTIAGDGVPGFSGDGGPALQAQLNFPVAVAVGPDGNLYIADLYNSRVRRVELPMTEFSLEDIAIPSDDGNEVYVFDRRGRHLQTLNALTGAMRYRMRYDNAGHLVALTDGDGNTVTIERDASGHPAALIAPFGQRTTFRLDAQGYLASATDPAGHSTQLTYTADGLLTRMTTPNGHRYRFSYDPLGRLARDEDPAGGFKALTRHELPSGFEVTLATALGRTTSYRVEEWPTGDRRRLNTLPSGLQEERWIGSNGRHITTLPDGTVHSLLLGPEPRFGMQAPLATQLQVTTPHGLVSNVTNARTITLADPHNPLSLLTQTDTLTLNGNAYISTFEAALRRLTLRTPVGRERISLFDAPGRILEARVDGLEPMRYTYDSLGRLASVAHGIRTSVLTYDAQGYLTSLTDPLGRSVGFAYDPAGRLLQQTLPDGRELRYTYDANGNLTSLTPPGRPGHAFAYTPVDLAAAYVPPELEAGPTPTQYAYNLDCQLVQVIRPDGTTIDVAYDGAGRLSTLTFPRGQLSSTYDPATGHLTTITAPDGGILTYGYDGSLLTSETWSGSIVGSVQYTYDNDFRLISQHVNGEVLATFQYDADGLLTQAGALTLSRHPQHDLLTGSALGNIATTWTYTSYGEPDSYSARFSGLEIFAVQYVRDALGRIIQKTEMLDGHTTIETYEYDSVGRLTHVQRDGNALAVYSYDSNGNRVSVTNPEGTVTATYDIQDRLTRYGSTTYTYTANGEVQSKTTSGVTTTYTYDALGNLTAVTLPDGTQIEYVIDGRNRRAGKKVNGTLVQGFLYSGQLRPVAELDGSGAMIARFIYGAHGNVPDYLVKGGRTYRILTDHLGSPRLVIDVATGHIVQRLAYDAFGRVVYDDNPGFQPFGFAGGMYDPDTKLTRFRARDYDAETGRWTAKDPIRFLGGDPNLYGYVLEDPINRLDPIGLFNPTKAISAVANALNAGRLYASGSLKLAAAAGLAATGVGTPGSAGLAFMGTWNLYSGTAAQQRAVQQWREAIAESWSNATWRNFLGVLPYGQQFDDPCEPTPSGFLERKYERLTESKAKIWEVAREIGTLSW